MGHGESIVFTQRKPLSSQGFLVGLASVVFWDGVQLCDTSSFLSRLVSVVVNLNNALEVLFGLHLTGWGIAGQVYMAALSKC